MKKMDMKGYGKAAAKDKKMAAKGKPMDKKMMAQMMMGKKKKGK